MGGKPAPSTRAVARLKAGVPAFKSKSQGGKGSPFGKPRTLAKRDLSQIKRK